MKRISALFMGILMLVLLGITVCYAESEYEMQIPSDCKKLCFDSNSRGAYVCGFTEKTVYSSEILPEFLTAWVTVSGNVKSVSQSGSLTYALIRDKNSNVYSVLELNPKNGAYKYYTLGRETDIDTACFSVSDGCIYLIKKDAVYAYVKSINLSDGKADTYRFADNVTALFNNNAATYAVLHDGSVYKLSGGSSTYCTSINFGGRICNAGAGYMRISTGAVVSLNGGNQTYINNTGDNCVSVSAGSFFYAVGSTAYFKNGSSTRSFSLNSAAKAVLSYGDKSAVIMQNNKCLILNSKDFQSSSLPKTQAGVNTYNDYFINSDGILCGIESGTTVAKFKKHFSSYVTVYDNSKCVVTSGKIRTGYSADTGNGIYLIAVAGDIAGAGDIKSNDVSALMDLLVGKTQMTNLLRAAADFNFDGSADNKDLVLIARKAN